MVVLYFEAVDVMALVVAVLSATCMYVAYDITKITKGAPAAWYVVIAAFGARFMYTLFILYVDVLTPATTIDISQTEAQVVTTVLFLAGLVMLSKTFRKSLKHEG